MGNLTSRVAEHHKYDSVPSSYNDLKEVTTTKDFKAAIDKMNTDLWTFVNR